MKIIKIEPNASGSRPALQEWSSKTPPEGYAICPDEFVSVFYSTSPAGFVNISVENNIVTFIEINQDLLDQYNETNKPDIGSLQLEKETEISDACYETIVAGCDATLSDGTIEHFALEETDQINLTTAYNAILSGATSYPYHADGALCRMYSAEDIIAISNAATAHKLYHTTYCNHLLAWVRRTETAEELKTIVYGAELPEDLAANMQEIVAASTSL